MLNSGRRDWEAEDRFRAFLAVTEEPKPRPRVDFQEREDLLSAYTLARTVAFLLYTLLVPLIVLAILFLGPFHGLSIEFRFIAGLSLFVTAEWLLFKGVSLGMLPIPNPEHVRPFNERQMELGTAIMSFIPWLLPIDPPQFFAFHLVINAFLILAVIVFFLTKSMLSRHWRWGVLRVLLIPLLQLSWLFRYH